MLVKTWFASIQVQPGVADSVLPAEKPAWADVLATARNEQDLRKSIEGWLREVGLTLLRLEDVELLSEHIKKFELEPGLAAAGDLGDEPNVVIFGIFRSQKPRLSIQ